MSYGELIENATKQYASEVPTVPRRIFAAGNWLEIAKQGGTGAVTHLFRELVSNQRCFGAARPFWRRFDAEEYDAARGGRSVLHPQRDRNTSNGEITVTASDFLERKPPTVVANRDVHTYDELIRCERSCIETFKKILCRDRALAPYGNGRDMRSKTDGAGGKLSRGIGKCKAAAKRAAVADRLMCDMTKRERQQRRGIAYKRGTQDFVVPSGGADHQVSVGPFDT